MKLWDMFICIDDPAYPFFIGICLLCKHRGSLLLADICSIPEIITGIGLKIESEGDVGVVVAEALVLYRRTPRYTTTSYIDVCVYCVLESTYIMCIRVLCFYAYIVIFHISYRCFLRDLRLCCVSSVELNPVVSLPPAGTITTDNTQVPNNASLSGPERAGNLSRLSTSRVSDGELKQHDIRMARQSVRN